MNQSRRKQSGGIRGLPWREGVEVVAGLTGPSEVINFTGRVSLY